MVWNGGTGDGVHHGTWLGVSLDAPSPSHAYHQWYHYHITPSPRACGIGDGGVTVSGISIHGMPPRGMICSTPHPGVHGVCHGVHILLHTMFSPTWCSIHTPHHVVACTPRSVCGGVLVVLPGNGGDIHYTMQWW